MNDDGLEEEFNETSVIELIRKLQHQMSFLEKKIDMLLERSSRSSGESFQRRNDFQGPRKDFGRFQGHRRNKNFRRDREGGFSQNRDRQFQDRERGDSSFDSGSHAGRQRSFDRSERPGGHQEGFGGKKPFRKKRWR